MTEQLDAEFNCGSVKVYFTTYWVAAEMSRPGSGTVHASSNVAASHLLGNYLT